MTDHSSYSVAAGEKGTLKDSFRTAEEDSRVSEEEEESKHALPDALQMG